jgi:hypothetical protein
MSGDTACLGQLGQMGCVLCPGTGGGGRECVVGCGAGCGVIAIGVAVVVMGWGSVMWGLGGVRGRMVGAHEGHTMWVSLLWGFPCCL